MHIVMVTDRPMRFWEAYNSGRSTQYPFGIIVLNVDSSGKRNRNTGPHMQDQIQQEQRTGNRKLRTEAASTGQCAAREVRQIRITQF